MNSLYDMQMIQLILYFTEIHDTLLKPLYFSMDSLSDLLIFNVYNLSLETQVILFTFGFLPDSGYPTSVHSKKSNLL